MPGNYNRTEAYQQGCLAFSMNLFNNPYPVDSTEEWDWEMGWMDASSDYDYLMFNHRAKD